jgi:hypothetical protein
MSAYDQPQQDRRIEDPSDRRDDRRTQSVNPATAPIPANPPIDREDLERGREKLERVLS